MAAFFASGARKNMLHLSSMALLVVAWLVADHYPPWSSFYNESCAALALLLLALGTGRQLVAVPAQRVVWGVAAVALIAPLQWALGGLAFSGDAVVSALYLLGFASAIAVGHAAARQGAAKTAAMLAAATLVAALVSSVMALNQVLDVGGLGIWLQSIGPGDRASANLGQPNNLATLIAFGALGLLLLREQGRCSAGLAAVLLGVLVLGASLTQSRTALLYGPMIAGGLWLARRHGGPFVTSPWIVLAATAVQWLLTWKWPVLQAMLCLDAPASLAQRATDFPRFRLWSMLLDAVTRSPWLGYGWLQVGEAELAVVNGYPRIGELWLHGHNLFLELLIWCGIPLGGLLIAGAICWFVARALRVRTKEAVVALLTIGVFGLHAMVELPHHYAYFLIPAGLWIGQIEWSVGAPGLGAPRGNLLPPVVALLLALGIWRDYPAVEEDYRMVRFETLRIGSLRASQPAPDAPFLSTLTAHLRFLRTVPRPGMSVAELRDAEAITKRYPYALSLSRYADMLALNGRLPEAQQAFKSIYQMYPPGVYRGMRRALQERVADGQAGLIALDRSVPD